jgi:hypothetical protein
MALRHGTYRNTLQVATRKKTTEIFFGKEYKAEMVFRLTAARLSSPELKQGAFRRDLVRRWLVCKCGIAKTRNAGCASTLIATSVSGVNAGFVRTVCQGIQERR